MVLSVQEIFICAVISYQAQVGDRNLVVRFNDLLGTFDDPRQNAFTDIVK